MDLLTVLQTASKYYRIHRFLLISYSNHSFLFSDLQKMLAGKKFSNNEEIVVEVEVYFEVNDEWY